MKNRKGITKAFKHDMCAGIFGNIPKFVPIVLFCLFVCAAFFQESLELTGKVPSFADYCLYLFKGMTPYNPNSNEPFTVPYIWLFFNLYIAYLIGNYPQTDLSGMGVYVLMRLHNRKYWWFGKCLWNLVTVAIFYSVIFFSAFLFSSCTGGLSMSASQEIQLTLSGLRIDAFAHNSWICYAFVLPVATSMAVSMFQMSLSFLTHPIISFICILAMYIVSAYYLRFPFGNYFMLLRSAPIVGPDGYSFWGALLSDAVLFALSGFFGMIYFQRYTVLEMLQGVNND